MFKSFTLISAAFTSAALVALPVGVMAQHEFQEFDSLSMIVEENATDGDTEVVIFAKTEVEGLVRLVVRGPDHKIVFTASSRDYGNVGIREYALETAEPAGRAVLDAYPEGTYTVYGRTVTGARVKGSVELSHALPTGPGFSPNGEVVDSTQDILVQWEDLGAVSTTVEIENDDLGFNLTTTLPSSQTSFVIAAGSLQPGTEYEIGILVENEQGNVVAVEGDFETAE